MDFSFFDAILDSVFVVNESREIHYCNEPAATMCGSSVRRMLKKELDKFVEFPTFEWFNSKSSPEVMDIQEVEFVNLKSQEKGLGQVAISAIETATEKKMFVILVRNVTLEEVLHQKYHLQLEEKQVVIDQLKVAQTELENYSKNLEKMVEERTEEVRAANVMLNAIMDSLGQGFLVFDKNGLCADFYTKACLRVLGTEPKGKMIWDVLGLKGNDIETFKMWIQAVFSNTLPFDSLKPLATTKINPNPEQHVDLDYFKIDDTNPDNSKVVLVATDVTAEYVARQSLEKEKLFAKMILKIVSNKNQFSRFLESAKLILSQVSQALLQSQIDRALVLRQLHTLEGESALFSISNIWSESRVLQEAIQANVDESGVIKDKPVIDEATKRLQTAFKDFMSTQSTLLKVLGIGKGETYELTRDSINELTAYLSQVGLDAEFVEDVESKLLSKSVHEMVGHYDDAVKILAERLNKKVKPVHWDGTDIKLRPDRYSNLFASFVHAFRNMLDHGIEPVEDRQMMGKPDEGNIYFNVNTEIDNGEKCLVIHLKDDGQGIDVSKLKKKLEAEGVQTATLSDYDIMQKIFDEGISTRDEVGEFSGRGIGMNAVKDEAEKLGGTAYVDSQPGIGTQITIRVPYGENKNRILKIPA